MEEPQSAVPSQPDAGEAGGGAVATSEGDAAPDTGENQDAQPDSQAGSDTGESLGPDKLAPELETQRKELVADYHKKLAEARSSVQSIKESSAIDKADADKLWKLADNPRFKQFMANEKARRSGEVQVDISPEELENAANDPKAILALIKKVNKSSTDNLRGDFEVALNDLRKGQADLNSQREVDGIASRYGDFREVQAAGLLDKYGDVSPEMAYKAYTFDKGTVPAAVKEEAGKLINSKRNGAVGKSGAAKSKGAQVIKAKDYMDAFSKVFDRISEGREVDRVEKE